MVACVSVLFHLEKLEMCKDDATSQTRAPALLQVVGIEEEDEEVAANGFSGKP